MSGRTYRRCACRNASGRQLNGACPRLENDSRHGTWTFALELPAVGGKRSTMRRSGFTTKKAARAALDEAVQRLDGGVVVDDRETLGQYLEGWLVERQRSMKPTSYARYRDYVRNDIVPALGTRPLEKITHAHVATLITDLERSGRGAVTIHRIHATLRSALSDAVKRRRLMHNPAIHAVLPTVEKTEKGGWTVAEAIGFLAHVHDAGERDADLFELLIGTGLRKGEALALRWSDVDTAARIAHVRQTLSSVDNSRLVFTAPKTKGSAAGVGLSKRVVEALRRQRERQDRDRARWGDAYATHDLVFARDNGEPLRPEYVLRKFRALTDAAGLPRVRVHDLRHLAASMMIAAGVPLPIVSKTLRHSTVSITSDVYSHLTADVAREAVDAMQAALDAAEAEARAAARAREALGAHTESPSHTQGAHNGGLIME
ncbi:tyrosine-type recombinase/integrase [Pseudonocardia alni]|uniref:tyrosine-type recombinase/integrase n=1 Tax=Pseudonocardia alni TaxID=33907 RepID=UPI0033283FF4